MGIVEWLCGLVFGSTLVVAALAFALLHDVVTRGVQ